MTRIVLISGSTREGSLHTAALRTAALFAPESISTALYDGLRTLPAFVPEQQSAPDQVVMLRHLINAADAVLVSTPQYAGSLPGSLKNLLDWLAEGGQLDDKPVAWLSLSPPGQDEAALAMLQTVLGHAGARVLQSACIRLPLTRDAVDERGLVGDPRLLMALQDTLNSLTRSRPVLRARQQPSWQAYSSVYPMVQQRDASATRRPHT